MIPYCQSRLATLFGSAAMMLVAMAVPASGLPMMSGDSQVTTSEAAT